MSFSVPRNVPSFGTSQRQAEDSLWVAAGMTRGGGGVASRLSSYGYMGGSGGAGGQLPMYKDKPYAAARRGRPRWAGKRALAVLVMLTFAVLYYVGLFSRGGEAEHRKGADGAKDGSWKWSTGDKTDTKKGTKVDWLKRRDMVVDAFKLSWDAYEESAWGKSLLAWRLRFSEVELD